AIAWAAAHHVELIGVSIANQRATGILWDLRTAAPLGNAIVWQDRRYAADLTRLAAEWDERLLRATGRTVGVRSLHLWLARSIAESPDVAAAAREGNLGFGTVDTWL